MKKLNKYGRLVVNLAVAGAIMTAVFFGAMVLSQTIKPASVEKNTYESIDYLYNQSHGCSVGNIPSLLFNKDCWTDNIMINACYLSEGGSPVVESMSAPYCGLYMVDDSADYHIDHYARYWHGYKTTLRPLLMFFNSRQIETISTIVLCVLFIVCILLMAKRIGAWIALLFAIAMLMVALPLMGECLQFTTCFVLMLAATIYCLAVPLAWLSDMRLAVTFFVIGGITNFYDFLTTPLLTLCIPLAVALIRLDRPRPTRQCLVCIACWFAGFVGLWLAKWILATVFTDENVIQNAISQLMFRSGGDLDFVASRHLRLFYDVGIPFAAALVAVTVAVVWRSQRLREAGLRYGWLLVLFLLPFAWMLVAANHTLTHFWFVWRVLAGPVFCYLCFISLVCKYKVSKS